MSMHEIEGLIVNTVHALYGLDIPVDKKRQLFANCYHLQNDFDVGYTHFHVMDNLLETEYMQAFGVNDFAHAKQYPDYYQSLKNTDFEFIQENPDDDNSPIIAVWDEETAMIYVEFGTPYYTLHDEAVVYEEPLAVATQIIELIYQKYPSLAYDWALFAIFYLLAGVDGEAEDLIAEYFSKIQPLIANIRPSGDELHLYQVNEAIQAGDTDWLSDTQNQIFDYTFAQR